MKPQYNFKNLFFTKFSRLFFTSPQDDSLWIESYQRDLLLFILLHHDFFKNKNDWMIHNPECMTATLVKSTSLIIYNFFLTSKDMLFSGLDLFFLFYLHSNLTGGHNCGFITRFITHNFNCHNNFHDHIQLLKNSMLS